MDGPGIDHRSSIEPGAAQGAWPPLGRPDYAIVTSRGLTRGHAVWSFLVIGGGSAALLVAAGFLRPWYAAVILVLSAGSILTPLVLGVGWLSWKMLGAAPSYICVFGDTVELQTARYGGGAPQRFRFALDDLIVGEATGPDLFRPRVSATLTFHRAIPVQAEGSAEASPVTSIHFPWPEAPFAYARFGRLLRLARQRRARPTANR